MIVQSGILLILTLFSATGKASEPLRVQLTSEPVSLDPARAEDGVSLRVLSNVMEGLMGYDGQGKLVPRLAARYSVSKDQKTYRFELRKDAQWSDGKPVLASEFVRGLTRALDPKTGSKTAPMLGPVESVTAPSEREVVIQLKEPLSYLVQAMALSVAYPVRQDVLEGLEKKKTSGKWPILSPSTGPYRIVEHQPDRKYVLERNAHYYSPPLPRGIGRVEFVIVSDESTGIGLLERGQLDIVTRVPSLEFERLKKVGLVRVDPFYATYFLSFNAREEPVKDRQWRKAFAAAIDKRGIAAAVGTGETPACSWVPPGLEGYMPCAEQSQDFSSAMGEFRARISSGKTPKRAQASFDSSSRNALIMEKVQADVKKNLGLELALGNQDWKSHVRSLSTAPAQVFRYGWLAPFADPISFLEVFTTGNPNNYTGWTHTRYDELVREIMRLKPGAERAQKIEQAQRILLDEESIVVPLLHYIQTHAVSPRVEGFRVNPVGVIRFDELTLKTRKGARS